eukprot:6804638-Heterocapsa_arctica.AAC.1
MPGKTECLSRLWTRRERGRVVKAGAKGQSETGDSRQPGEAGPAMWHSRREGRSAARERGVPR